MTVLADKFDGQTVQLAERYRVASGRQRMVHRPGIRREPLRRTPRRDRRPDQSGRRVQSCDWHIRACGSDLEGANCRTASIASTPPGASISSSPRINSKARTDFALRLTTRRFLFAAPVADPAISMKADRAHLRVRHQQRQSLQRTPVHRHASRWPQTRPGWRALRHGRPYLVQRRRAARLCGCALLRFESKIARTFSASGKLREPHLWGTKAQFPVHDRQSVDLRSTVAGSGRGTGIIPATQNVTIQ